MRRAFTLLELILVLVVLGVLTAIAAARLGGLRHSQGAEQAAQQALDQFARGQHLAAARSQAVRVRLDLDAQTSTIQALDPAGEKDPPDGQPALVALHDGSDVLTASWTPAGGTPQTSGTVDVLFLPDVVCAQPGTLTVTCGGRQVAVQCFLGAQPPARVALAEAAP